MLLIDTMKAELALITAAVVIFNIRVLTESAVQLAATPPTWQDTLLLRYI